MTFSEAKAGSLKKWDKPRFFKTGKEIVEWWYKEGSKPDPLCDYMKKIVYSPCCDLNDNNCICAKEWDLMKRMVDSAEDRPFPKTIRPYRFRQLAVRFYNRIEALEEPGA